MSQETYLTDADMADQLNVGESTLKLWRKRYTKWIPDENPEQPGKYPQAALEILQLIAGCTTSGMSPSEIEKMLTNKNESPPASAPANTINANAMITAGNLDNILLMILEQQKLIATAAERRASAEERKAFALESRAEAEMLKANAFQEIIATLKDSSVQGTVSSLMDKIQKMNGPSPENFQEFSPDFASAGPEGFDNLPELTETLSETLSETLTETLTETLDETLDENEPEPEETILPKSVPDDTAQQPVEDTDIKTDAASDIKEPVDSAPDIEIVDVAVIDMDDLSLLIDVPPEASAIEEIPFDMDDLSLLIDAGAAINDENMDDLSLLIDTSDGANPPPEDMDDLSMLLDKPAEGTVDTGDMDDLSLLISEEPQDMDDLSLLIDPPAAVKPTKPKPQPEAAAGDYKSQVLSRIIKMKEKDGLSVEETTKIFNDEGLKTLSGKGEWDTATITGIYKYIDSVREKGK